MTENIFSGKQLEMIATEAETINDYNSVRFWVDGKEVNAEDVKMVVYVEDEELEQFAKNANAILKKTGLRAVIIETSELYGEDGDVDKDDPYYMQPMYEGYLEDIENEEEIDNTRTGRYCSLGSVSEELEGFAQERKINHMGIVMQKLVDTRWRDREHLEKHLSETFQMQIKLQNSEADLVKDYAFVGGIFENHGYMDIYYLKTPFNNETIYITEVAVSKE